MRTEILPASYDNKDHDNDPFNNDDNVQTSMIDFGKGMRNIMENFKNCTEKIKESSVVFDHIKETRKLRNMFREFIKDSLDFNENLNNYSIDILFFVDCFKDNSCSNEEILVLLNGLLENSQENHRLAKELKNSLSDDGDVGIKDELITIQNYLQERTKDLKNEVDSDERALISYTGGKLSGTFYRALIYVVLGLARLINTFSKKKVFSEAAEKEERRITIKSRLGYKRDELDMIKLFDNNLRSIILEIGKIETFWDIQIKRIEYLIENLEKFSEKQNIQRRRIVRHIEQRWKNVGRECQIYYEVMKDALNNDKLAN